MQSEFFGGLNFGSKSARISIINLEKELRYSNSVSYEFDLKNPYSWINACEKLLANLPLDIKKNIVNLAISGKSGILSAFDLKGDPLCEAVPFEQECNKNKRS